MGFITNCKNFISDVLNIASNEGIVTLVQKTAANPHYVFEKIAEFDAQDAVFNQIDDMVAYLKFPAQKQTFFNKPNAKECLTQLIADAKKLDQRTAVRFLEDYLTDFEVYQNQQRNRPYELLRALIEKEESSRYYPPIIEAKTQEPLQVQAPAEVKVIQSELVIESQSSEIYDWNAPWEPYLELEIDELCDKFSALVLDGDPLNPLFAAKRVKGSHEDLGYIPSLEMMEKTLSFKLACNKRETQLMQEIIGDIQDHREISLKRASI
ncbi:MAG: hypothetical protein HYX61_02725 [Gammaproteobacteria bacterium]|jgi:hypothetical protein|nr:hypothetical protein [Gammaproteobacteria bacterium]